MLKDGWWKFGRGKERLLPIEGSVVLSEDIIHVSHATWNVLLIGEQ